MLDYLNNNHIHHYTLNASGIKFNAKVFDSRSDAKEALLKYVDRNDIQILTKYDDNHFKTYVCSDGIKFYINRI